MKWWEKTVEYYFVRKYISDEMIVSPLDGKEEIVADAMLSHNEKWVIIEFKRDRGTLASEAKKYWDYGNARQDLSETDDHHFLVYGEEVAGEFSLAFRTYFSGKTIADGNKLFEAGKDEEVFIAYLKKLISHKKSASQSSGDTTGGYSFVAGIRGGKKITRCMSLYEFGLDHGLDLDPSPLPPRNMRGFDGPSP